MEIKKGIGVSPGLAISTALVLDAEEVRIPQRTILPAEIPKELARLRQALAQSTTECKRLREELSIKANPQTAKIFDVHIGFLRDPSVRREITQAIRQHHYTAEYAVSTVMRQYADRFLKMPDPYMAERVKDIHDIERRLLRNLIGQRREDLTRLTKEVAVIAHDLTPSQTASFDHSKIKAIATDAGGPTSHTAIVAKALGIPAVVGLNDITTSISGGDTVIIDGNHGTVIINPDPQTLQEHRLYEQRMVEIEHDLDKLRDLPAVTTDGVKITLLGNIEFAHEVETTLAKGGEGIGLYRTEFLYLGSETEPTEEDHYRAYASAIEASKGKPVIIRTLDLGADKYSQQRLTVPERNPFLGCRSIRFCLQHLDAFKTQLRAILRASILGDVRIMFPLVTSVQELRQAKMVLRDTMEDLHEENIEYRHDIPVGVMIETPSAALTAKALAGECEFFSIGTNDLIQYTIAVDRGNERVAPLFTASHPAVLQLIRDVIRVGHRAGIEVSLCGEIASDPVYTLPLLGFGLRTLSISPPAIPEIKKFIRSVSIEKAQRVARKVLTFASPREVLNYLRDQARRVMPESF